MNDRGSAASDTKDDRSNAHRDRRNDATASPPSSSSPHQRATPRATGLASPPDDDAAAESGVLATAFRGIVESRDDGGNDGPTIADDAARRAKRRSRPPQKFVARPSKQGLSVEDGDAAFLKMCSSAAAAAKNKASKKRRRVEGAKGGPVEPAAADDDHDDDHDHDDDCNHGRIASEDANVTQSAPSTLQRAKKSSGVAGEGASRRRSKSTSASTKTARCATMATNATAGVEDNHGKRKDETDRLSPNGGMLRRKSAISRRPRRLRPTEKILAMQNDAAAAAALSSRSKSKTGAVAKKGSSAESQRECKPAPQKRGDRGLWLCLSCGWDNLETRKQCINCQGCRVDVRQDLTKSSDELERMNKSTEEDLALPLPLPSPLPSPSWQCTKCGNCVSATKARCGKCQGWCGGVRENIATKNKKKKKNTSGSSAKTNRDQSIIESNRESPNGEGTKSFGVAEEAAAEEHFENEEEHNNLDDVACCLCKCAVDFGDAFFFLPETHDAASKVEENDNDAKPRAEKVASAAVSSAIVSSECSVVDIGAVGIDASPASPMTVIRGADAAILTERILVDDVSSSVDGAENAEKAPSVNDASPSKGSKDVTKEPTNATILKGEEPSLDDGSGYGSQDPQPPFRLPHRFHDPRNSLILCDGPEYANRRKSSSGSQYRCDRAYHQLCHFIPVFNVPRGAWRCLICRYRDDEFLRRKASKGAKRKSHGADDSHLSDEQLSAIFRMVPETSPSTDTSSAERLFEVLSAPLKAKLLHAELTARAKSLINSSLSNIRTAEHSIRAFTETTKARKALIERIESMGLPQELIQCFARVAQAKMRIKDLIQGVENAIKTRQDHDPLLNDNGAEQSDCYDVVGELMHWYSSQKASDPDEILFRHLFPEGHRTFGRRRVEPRTNEANAEADAASNTSGVSLDNLRCACCLAGHASDENDLLLCDGLGCYRAYHMCCLEPKLTPEDVASDENEHWFCPLCKAHGELMHYAQREYLGDDFFSSPPPQEWERASHVFPEAHFETIVAQKLKKGIRDDEVNEFLSEALGISFSLAAQQTNLAASLDHPEDEEDESDEDFDLGFQEEEDVVSSSSEDSDEEEKQLLKEKIDKDELDALSVCSSVVETDDDVLSGSSADNARGRRSRKRRNVVRRSHGESYSDEDQRRGTSPPSDVGKLDTANIVYGKRNRTRVDYRKLNDAMFGDESDDEAQGADVKFAYKPNAKVRHDNSSSDESADDDESSEDHAKLAAISSKAKPSKTKLTKTSADKKRKRKSTSATACGGNNNDAWCCTKCGSNNLPTKKRCSTCQGWRGGVRDNIRSPTAKQPRT